MTMMGTPTPGGQDPDADVDQLGLGRDAEVQGLGHGVADGNVAVTLIMVSVKMLLNML